MAQYIDLPFLSDDKKLKLKDVSKPGQTIVSATVVTLDNRMGVLTESFLLFRDYTKRVINRKERQTRKAQDKAWDDALALIPSILEEVKQHYGVNQ